MKNIKCPLCRETGNEFVSNYPVSFFACKILIQCQTCEIIFANPIPSKEELNNFYSAGLYYDQDNDPNNLFFLNFSLKLSRSRLNLIHSKINFDDILRVIDIGAGNAQFGIALKECDDPPDYDAVEPDAGLRNAYGNWVNNHYSKINEVKVGSYDLVLINQVLEHLSDPVVFLESVCTLLKTSGYVYIDVPYNDYLYKPIDVIQKSGHLLFWNQKSISILLEKVGLKMIFCDTAGMHHKQAKRFFNRQSFMQKIRNPWAYKEKANKIFNKIGLPLIFDIFKRIEADKYGGNRQWLRCIAQKT